MNRVKRLVRMVFSRTKWWFLSSGRSTFNYEREAGDPMGSSAVAAVVLWFARNFPEAPPAMWRKIGKGQEEQEDSHPLLELLQRPNPHYTGPILWWSTTTDCMHTGEAYRIVIPSRSGTPVELWYTPSWMMEPKGADNDPATFVSYYAYTVDGVEHKLDPRYVVHFRYGLDSQNPRRGCSPLKAVLREIFTDNEAADFTASLLRNMGVPGLMVSPESGVTINEEEAKEAKADIEEKFSGDKRGKTVVMTAPTKLEQFGFSPEQLLLRDLRRIPEERVSAVTGVPAIVAGLGAGLERSTFTNMAEAREAAYESGLIPAQRLLGEDVRFQLLPLFANEDPFKWRFGFDLSKVRVLQEDLARQALRWGGLVRDGIAMVEEGRRGMGLEVDAARDRIFLRPSNVVEVDGSQAGGAIRSLAPAKNGNGNGNGAAHLGTEDIAAIGDELDRRTERRELTAAT